MIVVLVTVDVGVSLVESVVLIGNSVEVILDSDDENKVDDSMLDDIMVDVKSVVISVVKSVEPVFSVLIEDADAVVHSTELVSLVSVLLSDAVDEKYIEVDTFSLVVSVDSVDVTSVSFWSDVTEDDVDEIVVSSVDDISVVVKSVVDISVVVRSVVDKSVVDKSVVEKSVVDKSVVDKSVVSDWFTGGLVVVSGITCLFFRLIRELEVVAISSLILVGIVVSFSLFSESVVTIVDSSTFVVIALSSDDWE